MPTVTTNQNANYKNNSGQFIPVKVVDVVLDLNFPDIDKIGGWDALGIILFIKVSDIVKDPKIEFNRGNASIINSNDIAKPLFANTKYYPLKGEIVLVHSTLGRDIINDDKENYYIPNINIWNHPHHNALPNPDLYSDASNTNKTQKDYVNAVGGLVRQVQDLDSEIELGNYFQEQLNTKPLLPFEGDHIVEGRFGNSIRFGATAPGPNDWSTTGQTGDPITIIRTGQSDELDSKGWEPTVEDVNRDLSSIYLTSTQKLDKFVPASLNWQSWGAEPTVIEDPIEALSSPPAQEYTEPEPTTNEEEATNALIAGLPTSSADPITNEEEIESQDNTPPPPTPVEEETGDELSLYDELLASGDFDEEDFESFENPVISGQDVAVSQLERLEEGEIDLGSSGEPSDSTGNADWQKIRAQWKVKKQTAYNTVNGAPQRGDTWNYPVKIPGKTGIITTVQAPAPWSTVKQNLGPIASNKKYLVVHCTAGSFKPPVESILGQMFGDRGVKALGGSRGGYHIMITKNGHCCKIYDDTFTAYGAKGYNGNGIQINWMGGARGFNMTSAQAKTLVDIIKTYVARYPNIQVAGHNQVANKPCPRIWMPRLMTNLGFGSKNIFKTKKTNLEKYANDSDVYQGDYNNIKNARLA